MKPDFEQALQDALSPAEWQALLNDPAARADFETQLRMDALLRVVLQNQGAVDRLQEAIVASTQADPAEAVRGGIEAVTIGRRRARRRLGKPLQFIWTAWPRWTTAAAALVLGGVAGMLAWPELMGGRTRMPVITMEVGTSLPPQPAPAAVPEAPASPVRSPLPMAQTTDAPAPNMRPAPGLVASEPPASSARQPQPKPAPITTVHTPLPEMASKSVAPPPREGAVPAINLAAKPSPDTPTDLAVRGGARVDFEKQVLPLLERSCFECHSGRQKKPKGGLRLDDLEAIRAKSRTDHLLFPRKPDKSALIKVISLPVDHDELMPPTDEAPPLSAEEIQLLRRWVEEGADFGEWTSVRAREVHIQTRGEAVDAAQAQATAARIDELILQDLAKHGQEPRPAAPEGVWLRRVYLDLVGRIPTAAEAARFLKDPSRDKRARLVDTLLDSNGHVSHMFNYWSGLLRAKDELAEGVKGDFYLAWIKQSIRENKPYDQWARELLSPEGYGWRAPAAGYYLRDGENRAANIESTATLFLGAQIACAQCHDHPYDQWTRKDYHQFLAFTSGIQTATQETDVGKVSGSDLQDAARRYDRMAMNRLDPERRARYQRISDAIQALQRAAGGSGVVNGEGKPATLPGDYQYSDGKAGELLSPAVLYGAPATAAARPADALAAWVASPENERFSLTLANRLWANLFGQPFAGQVDHVRAVADCANPELAQYLVQVVRSARYDVRQILRILCLTKSYQAESGVAPENAEVEYRFPGPVARRLTAEQVWDSMMALAVHDLDAKLDFDPPGVKELEAAVDAKKVSEVTGVARQMANADEREMKSEQRRARLRKEMAEEFAGGGLERASELPQPTPPTHFLRMFGQGNRDFIGDSWSASTVPQALLMLNSDFFDHVARSGSPLSDSLRGFGNARDVARGAFLAVLTREPTPAELDACIETLGEARNPKALARTLLSTAEFVFQK